LTFFGLTPEHRQNIFTQIHEIVFNGNGGYTWYDVYNMPIWLRKFTFQKIQSHFDDLAEQNKSKSPKNKKTFGPDIKPSFTAKASKK
jgi:hypothetical protein